MIRLPRVLRIQHNRIPPGAVYIGRQRLDLGPEFIGTWGNPWVVGRDGTRDAVIAAYRDWLLSSPGALEKIRAELGGRDLACWCAPQPCHGDVLLRLANPDIWPDSGFGVRFGKL